MSSVYHNDDKTKETVSQVHQDFLVNFHDGEEHDRAERAFLHKYKGTHMITYFLGKSIENVCGPELHRSQVPGVPLRDLGV
jgi:hypothetical protein